MGQFRIAFVHYTTFIFCDPFHLTESQPQAITLAESYRFAFSATGRITCAVLSHEWAFGYPFHGHWTLNVRCSGAVDYNHVVCERSIDNQSFFHIRIIYSATTQNVANSPIQDPVLLDTTTGSWILGTGSWILGVRRNFEWNSQNRYFRGETERWASIQPTFQAMASINWTKIEFFLVSGIHMYSCDPILSFIAANTTTAFNQTTVSQTLPPWWYQQHVSPAHIPNDCKKNGANTA